ncbi:Activator of Hsp90 ATPase homolog 1-like protein [Salinimicrobium catena]|uniref:Activator of Hsp90 ATPase homolog 1-like protein n=1 Tax=Salinimicrobium catena TaxID=390640 RepID=A0A1H5HBN9_9FLAO|nr:SRPBCC domain-containing protein [Salinimicrobium catena]SDK68985.1 Activator of Hsp90 ATPase homolog 1-like protein [Salinimicrobium catena]SEE25255.1 Activator of Hsp90 ATPase homolog 1-like protein [Salinimicrobium catena]
MEKVDWSRFVVRTALKVSNEEIKTAWTTPAGLEKWFLRMAEFTTPKGEHRDSNENVQVHDTYRWRWHGYPDSVEEQGEVLEPQNDEIIRFRFGKAGIVSVKIKEIDREKVIELLQEDIPQDEESKMNFHAGCKTGWTFYPANLKSVLEGGHDLRNKNVNLKLE